MLYVVKWMLDTRYVIRNIGGDSALLYGLRELLGKNQIIKNKPNLGGLRDLGGKKNSFKMFKIA
jgi:hypothetical protein